MPELAQCSGASRRARASATPSCSRRSRSRVQSETEASSARARLGSNSLRARAGRPAAHVEDDARRGPRDRRRRSRRPAIYADSRRCVDVGRHVSSSCSVTPARARSTSSGRASSLAARRRRARSRRDCELRGSTGCVSGPMPVDDGDRAVRALRSSTTTRSRRSAAHASRSLGRLLRCTATSSAARELVRGAREAYRGVRPDARKRRIYAMRRRRRIERRAGDLERAERELRAGTTCLTRWANAAFASTVDADARQTSCTPRAASTRPGRRLADESRASQRPTISNFISSRWRAARCSGPPGEHDEASGAARRGGRARRARPTSSI